MASNNRIKFGKTREEINQGSTPCSAKSLSQEFGEVAGTVAKATGSFIVSLAKDFVHAVGPVSAAGILALALIGGVGVVAMKDKVTEVMNLRPTK